MDIICLSGSPLLSDEFLAACRWGEVAQAGMSSLPIVKHFDIFADIRSRLQMESLCVCCDDTEKLDAHSRPEDAVYDYARVDSSYISATMLKALNLAIIKAIDAGYLDDWARDKVQAAMEELREDFRVSMSLLSNEQKAVHAFCC